MDSPVSEDFKLGYLRALGDVFHVLMDNMDDEVKERVLNNLKLKRV